MTTSRRDVLKSGAALAAIAASSLPLQAVASDVLRFYKVAYDGRFREGSLFGARARLLGADVHDIDGDITGLWYDHLYRRWKQSPDPVAGLTQYNSLLALQMMASVDGLRVIYRAHHVPGRAGARHEAFGPTRALASLPALSGSAEQWPAAAAEFVMRWRPEDRAIDRARSTILDADTRGCPAGALVSWILAPVSRSTRAYG